MKDQTLAIHAGFKADPETIRLETGPFGELLALEVKSKERFVRELLSGLLAIGDLEGLARRILVYRGSRELVTGEGIEVWPIQRFLQALEGDDLWP